MAQYQVKVLGDDYSLVAWLDRWLRLHYRLELCAMTAARLDLAANDAKIADCDLGRRLHLVRDGQPVWGGLLQSEAWEVGGWQESPYALDATSYECYLQWRVVERMPNDDFWRATDHADDVAKHLVRTQCGALAAPARQYPDLSVQADTHAAPQMTKLWVGGTVLEHCQRIAAERGFWWRVAPGATGCEFQTAYPLWGTDRRKGNGVNDELVFAFDRGNVSRMSYKRDLIEHYNYVYMGGAGEGKDQLMEEVADTAAVTAWRRRELWQPATNYTTAAGLQAEGQRVLAEHKPVELMEVQPVVGTLSPANLGDLCTVFERRYGRVFRFDAMITAMSIKVDKDGVERITPELIAYE